jgi:hypothetical protein
MIARLLRILPAAVFQSLFHIVVLALIDSFTLSLTAGTLLGILVIILAMRRYRTKNRHHPAPSPDPQQQTSTALSPSPSPPPVACAAPPPSASMAVRVPLFAQLPIPAGCDGDGVLGGADWNGTHAAVVHPSLVKKRFKLQAKVDALRKENRTLQEELRSLHHELRQKAEELSQRQTLHDTAVSRLTDINRELEEEVKKLREENAELRAELDKEREARRESERSLHSALDKEREARRESEHSLHLSFQRLEGKAKEHQEEMREKMRQWDEDIKEMKEFVAEEKVHAAKMIIGEHAWLLKSWMLFEMTAGRAKSFDDLSESEWAQFCHVFKMSDGEARKVTKVIRAFARERSEVAHDRFKRDLSYDDYRSRLKLAVSDAQRREATEENGLMIRRKLEELNATFAAFEEKTGESD